MNPARWSVLTGAGRFTDPLLAETLCGGQAFRWYWLPEPGSWVGIWAHHVVFLHRQTDGHLAFASPTQSSAETVLQYLARGRSARWAASLPRRADPVLARLARRWAGLPVLAQPPGETLLAFLCSSNKRIPHIRAMLHLLAVRAGQPIPGTPFHALPDWARLADLSEPELRACSLGYRAAHVRQTARFLRKHPGWLDQTATLPYPEAHRHLLQLPGVGPKVADCCLLFGFGFGEAFPVDTWIHRALAESYPELASWPRPQLATFARIHFGPAAGLAQQWFFAQRRPPLQRPAPPASTLAP